MDDPTLASLRAALEHSPDNQHLLALLLDAYLERDDLDSGRELLAGRDLGRLDGKARLSAAKLLLAAGDHQIVLDLTAGGLPEENLLRARALLALGRHSEGWGVYLDAVAVNPTLEDPDLLARLNSPERPAEPQRLLAAGREVKASADSLFLSEQPRIDFSGVGGLEEVKSQIRKRIILPFQKPSLYQRFKKKAGGGLLLYGPPGCGKTLLARATAGECNASFFNVAISDVLDMYVGESERKLHELFEKARRSAPAVLFFDEVEALGGKRRYRQSGMSSQLVSQFLSEMDGFSQNNQGVLMLGATNVPWEIDLAFRRPGRFDRFLFVPPPDRAARRAILELLLRDRPVADGLEFDRLLKATSGFSGADLESLVDGAADEAIEASIGAAQERPIAREHLEKALANARSTTTEWLTTARNHARYANESGFYDEVLAFLNAHGKAGAE